MSDRSSTSFYKMTILSRELVFVTAVSVLGCVESVEAPCEAEQSETPSKHMCESKSNDVLNSIECVKL